MARRSRQGMQKLAADITGVTPADLNPGTEVQLKRVVLMSRLDAGAAAFVGVLKMPNARTATVADLSDPSYHIISGIVSVETPFHIDRPFTIRVKADEKLVVIANDAGITGRCWIHFLEF